MKLTNPLYYPVAVLAGGVSLIIGVRFIQLPSVVMLPFSAGVVVVGASYLKSREPESLELDNPELEREIQSVRSSALALVAQANELRLETKKLLTDSFQVELLAAIQTSCDRAIELPAKIDNLARRLKGNNALLSVDELQRQLTEVQQKLQSSSGIAKQHLGQLAESLKRNIQLAQEGQDTRLAQIVSLSTQIQDFAGVLQQLQTKLHTADLTDAEQITQLQALSDEMGSLRDNMYLLVSK
jgi:chromosome segregation ATPase